MYLKYVSVHYVLPAVKAITSGGATKSYVTPVVPPHMPEPALKSFNPLPPQKAASAPPLGSSSGS